MRLNLELSTIHSVRRYCASKFESAVIIAVILKMVSLGVFKSSFVLWLFSSNFSKPEVLEGS